MEEEIDLRPYVLGLARRWYLLVGAALVAVVAGYAASFLLAPSYEATALVAVTNAEDLIQLDPRFEPSREAQLVRAYPVLALGDELLVTLQDTLAGERGIAPSLDQMRRNMRVRSADDPRLLILTVTDRNAADAASMVNVWAELFVTQANDLFIGQNDASVAYFTTQYDTSVSQLALDNEALTEFQTRNRLPLIQAELNTLLATQASYLDQQRQAEFLLLDIEDLRIQVAGQSAETVTLVDQLTALTLQLRAFDRESTLPVQLNLDPETDLTTSNRAEQLDALDQLALTLQERSFAVSERLVALEPRVLQLQSALQELQNESAELQRNRDLTEETVTALARKVREEEIASQDTSSGFKVASRGSVPTEPIGPPRAIIAAGSGAVGLIAAFTLVVGSVWRGDAPKTAADRPPTAAKPAPR